MSDAMLACFLLEKAAIRESSVDVPVTTNLMGMYRPIDYHRWAPHLDVASWDMAAGLDQAGVSWVVRQVLDRHGLVGPYADVPDLETAVRVTPAGRRVRFLLNHRSSQVTTTLHCGGVDLLAGEKVASGQEVALPPHGVLVLAENR